MLITLAPLIFDPLDVQYFNIQRIPRRIRRKRQADDGDIAGGMQVRHFFVINPHSFRTVRSWRQIMMDLESCFSVGHRVEYKIYTSRHPRDAIAAVDRYLSSVPSNEIVRVYAVGGDGILFDCLEGMADFPNAELTSVPYGSSNDFVRAYGEDSFTAFRDIKRLSVAPSHPIDIILCGTNHVINEANIGLVGLSMSYSNAVFRNTSSMWVKYIASQIYAFSGFRALLNKEVMNQKYTVIMDGYDVSGTYSNIHISNGPCNGKQMTPNPYAIPNDGLLNAIFLRPARLLNIAKTSQAYMRGHFEKYKEYFTHKMGQKLEVYSDLPLHVELDGEAFLAKEMTFEIIPKGIKFFAPEGVKLADYTHKAYKKSKEGAELSEITESGL